MLKRTTVGLCILLLMILCFATGCSTNTYGLDNRRETMEKVSLSKLIEVDNIQWITMQGGVFLTTKVLFSGHDNDKIARVVEMINSSKIRGQSTREEIRPKYKRARPIKIIIKMKSGREIRICPVYIPIEGEPGIQHCKDRFVFYDGYNDITCYSPEVAAYLSQGWRKDMPAVHAFEISSPKMKEDEHLILTEGDPVTVSGDGCIEKEVVITISQAAGSSKEYVIGRVKTVYGKWEWTGVVKKCMRTVDGQAIRLASGEYEISASYGKSRIETMVTVNFRGKT